MEDFIDSITNLTISKKVKNDSLFLYDYYNMYSNNISLLSEKEKDNVGQIVYERRKDFLGGMFKFLNYYFSIDTSNVNDDKTYLRSRDYILFSLYSMLYQLNMEEIYYNEIDKMELYVLGLSRVDEYYGCIKKGNKEICECNIYVKFNFPMSEKFINRIIFLKDFCMPHIFLNFKGNHRDLIVIESPIKLDIKNDCVLDVLVDLVNQLRGINNYYYFQYLEPRAIGKSNKKMCQKYFIFDFIGLEDKDSKIIHHNVFDGRDEYDKIENVDQVRMIINILADIYICFPKSQKKKMEIYPFDKMMEYLEVFKDNTGDPYLNYMRKIMSLVKS